MEARQKHESFVLGDDLAEVDSKILRIESESECQEQENEIKKTDTNQKILEEETS